MAVWLIGHSLTSRSKIFTYMERSPLPVKGCKILAYAWRSGPLSREGSLSCDTYCDTGPWFFLSHPTDRPIQWPPTTQHTRGCGGSILTRILTGPYSVASYDTQGGCRGPVLTRILTGLWPSTEDAYCSIAPGPTSGITRRPCKPDFYCGLSRYLILTH
jgi:hypothetical protein